MESRVVSKVLQIRWALHLDDLRHDICIRTAGWSEDPAHVPASTTVSVLHSCAAETPCEHEPKRREEGRKKEEKNKVKGGYIYGRKREKGREARKVYSRGRG